jgi:mannose-6-phosphate isomerase-like protein (cupin superfamily)
MKRFKKTSWGYWIVLLNRKHFKIKLLKFKQGGSCSLQYHHHRNEVWLFLKGYGNFFNETGFFDVEPGDAKFVRKGVIHRYISNLPSLVLEIQFGEKCEESDIVKV